MADAHKRDAWSHTSNILATIYNCHRGPDNPAASAADFNPFCPPRPKLKMNIRDMRAIFQGVIGIKQ